MKRTFLAVTIIFLAAIIANAQSATYRVFTRATLPATCKKTASSTDVVVLFASGVIYTCINPAGVFPANWGAVGTTSGSGANGRVAFWNGTSSLSSNAGFLFDGTTLTAPEVATTDEAYDATTWNGSVEVPTKNAIRDKIETLGGGGEQLLSSTTVNVQDTVAWTDLYTVPSGKTLVITKVILRSATNTLAGGDTIFIRDSGTTTNIIQLDVTSLNVGYFARYSLPNGTPTHVITAGNKAQARSNQDPGAAITVVIDLFGYTF